MHCIPVMTLTDYMCQEEREERLASMDTLIRLEDYIEKCERRLITDTRNNTNDTSTSRMTITRKQKWEEKQLYARFKQLTSMISHEKTWLRKGNLKGETKSLQIAKQNNAIWTNHIKARRNRTKQNSRCRLYGERDKTINHIISECSKLAQKEYKITHDWMGKVIPWELWKKLKFDHMNSICPRE